MLSIVDRCRELLAEFPRKVVVGIGDLILDQYRRGSAVGLSPEAPVADLLNPDLHETPGGAANVAWNIGYLGGQVRMIGVIGTDAEGRTLRQLLAHTPGVSLQGIEDPSRRTTLKLRFYHAQFQVLRVSHESKEPLRAESEAGVREAVLRNVEGSGALCIADYGKGVVSPALVTTLLEIRRARPDLPVVLDPKVGNHAAYQPGMCTLLKPNWKEACLLVGANPETADRIAVARTLSEKYACDALLTLGADGALVFERTGKRSFFIPTRPREAFDVAGAGDTMLAAATLALASGASLVEAAIIANLAGGVVVEKLGTAYATPEEILVELRNTKTQEILAPLEERLPARVA